MSFSEALVYIAAIGGWTAMVAFFIRARWPEPSPTVIDARIFAELALLRDELSKQRAETLRDRDDLRTEVGKHERAFVAMTNQVNDCIKVSSQLSVQLSQVRR